MANRIEVTASLKDDLTARLDRVSNSVNRATRDILTLGPFANQLALALSGVAEGLLTLPFRAADTAEKLGKLKTATGLAYKELQALQQAVSESGGDPTSLNAALRILNVNLAQSDKVLARYGITARTTYEAVLQIGKRFAELPTGIQRSELAIAAFGRSSQDLIDTVMQFSTDPELRKSMEAAGLTDAGIGRLQRVDEQMDRLARTWKRFTNAAAELSAGPAAKGLELLMRFATIAWETSPLRTAQRIADEARRRAGVSIQDSQSRAGMYPAGAMWAPGSDASFWTGAVRPQAPGAYTPPSRPSAPSAGSFVSYPQFGYGPNLRTIDGGFFGNDFANRAFRTMRLLKPAEGGASASQDRTLAAVNVLASGVVGTFEQAWSRILGISTRSGNVFVQIVSGVWNSIIASVGSRLGSALGNWVVDFAAGFIPGGGAVRGAAGGASQPTTIIYNGLDDRTFNASLSSPTGGLNRALTHARQRSRFQ